MAPKLSEEDIDDVLYFSRVGENDDLSECLTALAERENVSQAEILLEAKNEGKSTALHMATGNGHLGTLRSHLFLRPRNDQERLREACAPIDVPANSLPETVRRLLQCFEGRPTDETQTYLDEANEHGNTGLHWAALGGHLAIVKLLMEHGASPALANESNYVPLDLANLNEKRAVVEHFLASAGMLESKNGDSGLATAAESIELSGDDEQEAETKAS